MTETETTSFSRYFTLEEAVDLLPDIRFSLAEAHREMAKLQDELILSKRLMLARQKSRRRPSEEEAQLLKQKAEHFEAAYRRWQDHFEKQGVLLRNLATGLIDFPYRAASDGEEYFLCWKPPEEGIFYFHSLHDGFVGRHPISLLPD
jgi:hypothetical protein